MTPDDIDLEGADFLPPTRPCRYCGIFQGERQQVVLERVCRACARRLDRLLAAPPVLLDIIHRAWGLPGASELRLVDALVLASFLMAQQPHDIVLTPRTLRTYLASRGKLDIPTSTIRRSLQRLARLRILEQVGGGGRRGGSDLEFKLKTSPLGPRSPRIGAPVILQNDNPAFPAGGEGG